MKRSWLYFYTYHLPGKNGQLKATHTCRH